MKVITGIKLNGFRSFRDQELTGLGDLTALAGPNNSGKSNVLRGLNAFFTGMVEEGKALTISSDFHRPLLRTRKAKRIGVEVGFVLPSVFRFRKGMEAVRDSLPGSSFRIRKEWSLGSSLPDYYLDGELVADGILRERLDQFLGLISFRYIPNRVRPLDVVAQEHGALRDVLIRRISRKAKNPDSILRGFGDVSAEVIANLSEHVVGAFEGLKGVRLATPKSWRDLVLTFGYMLNQGTFEVEDDQQGSGLQAALMFETLALIDCSYSQRFGWKQATVWAVEEPESSLHVSLEAHLSRTLAGFAGDAKNRLQIVATTHSDILLQFADECFMVEQSGGETKCEAINDTRQILEQSAIRGVSRWAHPVLAYPLSGLVLVEGKHDVSFLRQAIRLIAPESDVHVSSLAEIESDTAKGGVQALIDYIRRNIAAIRTRSREAPVIVLLDWDSAGKVKEIEKAADGSDRCFGLAWPVEEANPRLGKEFKGIERYYPDRVLREADRDLKVLGSKQNGTYTIGKDDLGELKVLAARVVAKGLSPDDVKFAKGQVARILALLHAPYSLSES